MVQKKKSGAVIIYSVPLCNIFWINSDYKISFLHENTVLRKNTGFAALKLKLFNNAGDTNEAALFHSHAILLNSLSYIKQGG